MATLQFPRIHLNGTSGQTLFDEYEQALSYVRTAIKVMGQITVNGRDYYPISADATGIAIAEHRSRLDRLTAVAAELEEILTNISEQVH